MAALTVKVPVSVPPVRESLPSSCSLRSRVEGTWSSVGEAGIAVSTAATFPASANASGNRFSSAVPFPTTTSSASTIGKLPPFFGLMVSIKSIGMTLPPYETTTVVLPSDAFVLRHA